MQNELLFAEIEYMQKRVSCALFFLMNIFIYFCLFTIESQFNYSNWLINDFFFLLSFLFWKVRVDTKLLYIGSMTQYNIYFSYENNDHKHIYEGV